jgi:predicted nucleic acid-binding protein
MDLSRTARSELPDRFFLDSNILIYGLAAGDPSKRKIARQLFENAQPVISTQVLLETSNVLTRKAGLRAADATHVLQPFLELEVVSQSREVVEGAWRISERFGFGVFDSAIIASALTARCKILYSEDLQHNQRIESLRIVNPFA